MEALHQEVLEQALEQVLEVAQAVEQEVAQAADQEAVPAPVVAAADLQYPQVRQNQLQLAR